MAGWDPSFVDPTSAPADALVIRSPGGRTGSLNLENGAALSFPWKSQQQIAGSTAAYISAVEVTSAGTHQQDMYLAGPSLVSGTSAPFLRLSTAYSDDTYPNRRQVYLATSTTNKFEINSYSSTSGYMMLESGQGHALYLQSYNTANLTSFDHAVLISGGTNVEIKSGITASPTTANVLIYADDPNGVVELNSISGSNNAVRVNGYPVVPLRAVQNAAVGTAPSVTAVAPAYKTVAGRQAVAFTAGAGTLTLPSSQFATGLLCIVCTAEANDFVVAHNAAASTKTAIALTGFDAGTASNATVTIDYIAIGW